jgi:tetratricopeptide (TPR) repeat protein
VTACAFFLVLILAAGVSIWQGVRATKQRDRADAEAAVSRAVNQFLQADLLSQANPDVEKPDPDIKVRVLLDRAAAQVGKRFASQPLVESAIRRTIANTYRHLGLGFEAERQMRRAYELSRVHRGAGDLETAEILQELSYIVTDQGRYAEALDIMKTVFEVESRKLAPEDPRIAHAMQDLGLDHLNMLHYAQAEPLLKKALEFQIRRLGYDDLQTLYTIETLAALYIYQAKYAEADALLTKALESRRVYGPDHPHTNARSHTEVLHPNLSNLLGRDAGGCRKATKACYPDSRSGRHSCVVRAAQIGALLEFQEVLVDRLRGDPKQPGGFTLITIRCSVGRAILPLPRISPPGAPPAWTPWRPCVRNSRPPRRPTGSRRRIRMPR